MISRIILMILHGLIAIFHAAVTGNDAAGRKNILMAFGRMLQAESPKTREAKRESFLKTMERMKAAHEVKMAKRREERRARGLIDEAGTGLPFEEISLLRGKRPELEYPPAVKEFTPNLDAITYMRQQREGKVLAELVLGQSRIGGIPDLPSEIPWPMHNGKRIPFIAQINLAELPGKSREAIVGEGHLFFFALISNDEQHWPPPCKVIYYPGNVESLARAHQPDKEEIWKDWCGERVYELLPVNCVPSNGHPDRSSYDKSSKLAGWLFGEMLELYGTAGHIADGRFEDGDDWINLLAVKSAGSMTWSDVGDLYFLIRRSSLMKLDFSNVLAAALST